MAKAVCDRCGFVVNSHAKLRKEWTSLMVCSKCFDPRPADTKPPRIKPEGLPIHDARAEPPETFREDGALGGEDL